MRSFFLLVQVSLLCVVSMGAKSHVVRNPLVINNVKNKEVQVLELKLKRGLSDKKISSLRKYTLAILAAREMQQLKSPKKSLAFYKMANEIKNEMNKTEIQMATANPKDSTHSIFFFDVNLKSLIQNQAYEKAILSINPERLNDDEFASYRIIYDLLNVKIKKRLVKNLYCYQDYQKDPDSYYQYSTLLCDLLLDYLRDGKLGNDHIKVVEEYFFKHDLKERYLLQLAKDLNHLP